MNEKRLYEFQKIKKSIKRKFPNATTKFSTSAGYKVEDGNGRAIIANYPDLCYSDTVFGAWKNTNIVLHWNNIENRNVKKSRIDIKNIVGNSDNIPAKEGWEYKDSHVSNTGEVYDEANQLMEE
tara:strand:+ start:2170 stop:2541 length:372 start_codon:yes stop_codon:yes gene_type:complete